MFFLFIIIDWSHKNLIDFSFVHKKCEKLERICVKFLVWRLINHIDKSYLALAVRSASYEWCSIIMDWGSFEIATKN